MKVTIWNGKEFEFNDIEKEEDLRTMPDSRLDELYTDIIDEREGLDDMDEWGLVLDEVYALIVNEKARRKDNNITIEEENYATELQ